MTARLLCVIGSGEMSPRMASVHADLIRRIGTPADAVMIDTPYGFQENAGELSQRAIAYFRDRVRHPIGIASFRDRESVTAVDRERFYNQLRDAPYIFAGPGSPSYALRQWRDSQVPALLARRLADGGCVTVASAAAVCLARFALPVYEIYKVGLAPHWLDGLDLLAPLGVDAIVPHYDNTEGGTHDTSFCYMGARRFVELERRLPAGATIFGVAEHTAAIFDLDARTLEVRGRGFAVIRRNGSEQRFQRGQLIRLDGLLHASTTVASSDSSDAVAPTPAPNHRDDPGKKADQSRRVFEHAIDCLDTDGAVAILLELDDALAGVSMNGVDRDALARARSVYRGMLVRLTEALQRPMTRPREPVAPFVELALRLRDEARRERRYPEADLVREALQELGIEVRDTPVGPEWSAADSAQ